MRFLCLFLHGAICSSLFYLDSCIYGSSFLFWFGCLFFSLPREFVGLVLSFHFINEKSVSCLKKYFFSSWNSITLAPQRLPK